MRRFLSLLATISTIFLVALCLGSLVLGWYFFNLPDKASAAFGSPTPGLSLYQRYYLSAKLITNADDLTKANEPGQVKQNFIIEPGESTYSITNRLFQAGLISNDQALRDYLVYKGLDTTLAAGKYQLSPGMTAIEIAHQLQSSTPGEVTFHILAGWRIEEIAAALPTSGLSITPEAFIDATYHPTLLYEPPVELPSGGTLEGFLYPDAYHLDRSTTLNQLLQMVLKRSLASLTPDLRQGFQRQGLSVYQAVTLASMIQREAMREDEMPMLASVFLNRLAIGMKLDSDATVQYALGYQSQGKTWWKNPLTIDDLQIDSPYNTYRLAGLPPGPIANPSLSAINSVAFPAQSPYYYFQAACDGSGRHNFSKTFQEHVNKSCP